MAITPRQRDALDFLYRYYEINRRAPTIPEMQAGLDLSSSSSVAELLSALEREGYIRRTPHAKRGIKILKRPENEAECEIPLLGRIAAGRPITAVLTIGETICIPRDMLGQRPTYALLAEGDSMIEDGILDGDYLIVEAGETADDGQTVVALIDGAEATVKRLYRERGRIRLQPANPSYKPLFIKPPNRLEVQGVLIGSLRRYPRGKRKVR